MQLRTCLKLKKIVFEFHNKELCIYFTSENRYPAPHFCHADFKGASSDLSISCTWLSLGWSGYQLRLDVFGQDAASKTDM